MVSFSSVATLQISTKILSDITCTHFFFFWLVQYASKRTQAKKEINTFLFEANFISFLILTFKSTFYCTVGVSLF